MTSEEQPTQEPVEAAAGNFEAEAFCAPQQKRKLNPAHANFHLCNRKSGETCNEFETGVCLASTMEENQQRKNKRCAPSTSNPVTPVVEAEMDGIQQPAVLLPEVLSNCKSHGNCWTTVSWRQLMTDTLWLDRTKQENCPLIQGTSASR